MATAREELDELLRDKVRPTGHPDDNEALSDSDISGADGLDPSTEDVYLDSEGREEASPNWARPRQVQIPMARYAANTGPKGVIADAQKFKESRRLHRQYGESRQWAHSSDYQEVGLSSDHSTLEKNLYDAEEDFDDINEDEDSFMTSWRQKRMRELQNGSTHKNEVRKQLHNDREQAFGTLVAVDADGYLEAVEHSPPGTTVIVYIFDNTSEVSLVLEGYLRELAKKHTSSRFVKLHYLDAEMEPAGVPALLAYQDGDKFAGLVPLVEEIPDDADVDAITLGAVLQRHQILT